MSKKYPPQQLHIETLDESHTASTSRFHIPVLLDAVLEVLQPVKGETYLDLTAGYGGHTAEVIKRTENPHVTLVDRDSYAITALESFQSDGARVLHTDFVSAAHQLVQENMQFDMVLIDLGVSSPQLDNKERGFSFQADAPLDMRMDARLEKSAEYFVNKTSKKQLINLIHTYGEEPYKQAVRIADAIIKHRPITSTRQLADVIKQAHRGGWQKIHPATRTFQALRIMTNDELGQVSEVLPLLPHLLKPGGRVAIISFHSLEDRLVKQYFKEQSSAGYEATLQLINKKPILGALKDVTNPRARSAKLRAAVKINTKERV